MAAMAEFLAHIETPQARALYADIDAVWNTRAERLNQRSCRTSLPGRSI